MPIVTNSVRRRLTLNLSRIPKASKSKNSLNYKGATQGSAGPFSGRQNPTIHRQIDRPLVRTLEVLSRSEDTRFKPWSFPFTHSLTFTLRIVPKKVVGKPELAVTPPRSLKRNKMPVRFVVSKKVYKLATVRTRMCNRITKAVRLIVARSVTDNSVGGKPHVSGEDAGVDNWLLSDWTYIFYPTLETSKIALSELMDELRIALKTVQSRGISWQKVVRIASKAMKNSISLQPIESLSRQSNESIAQSIPTFMLEDNTSGDGNIDYSTSFDEANAQPAWLNSASTLDNTRAGGKIDYPEIVDDNIKQIRMLNDLQWNNIVTMFEKHSAQRNTTTSKEDHSLDTPTQNDESDVAQNTSPETYAKFIEKLMPSKRTFVDPMNPSKRTTNHPQPPPDSSPASKLYRTNIVVIPPQAWQSQGRR